MNLCFIGSGKMATAIAEGLIDGGILETSQISASDVSGIARRAFTERTGISCLEDNTEAIAGADTVLLAVKPQVARNVLSPLRAPLRGKLFISIAAGIRIDKLSEWIDSNRVIRVMPNTPATVGLGAAVYSSGEGISDNDKKIVQRIFGSVGIIFEMSENNLDAVTGVSGSGPAYVFEFIQALVDAASDAGLPPDIALDLVTQTVAGAAEMVKRRVGTPDELRNAVTSPGGTTEAGLTALAEARFRDTIKETVRRATKRSKELSGDA